MILLKYILGSILARTWTRSNWLRSAKGRLCDHGNSLSAEQLWTTQVRQCTMKLVLTMVYRDISTGE